MEKEFIYLDSVCLHVPLMLDLLQRRRLQGFELLSAFTYTPVAIMGPVLLPLPGEAFC